MVTTNATLLNKFSRGLHSCKEIENLFIIIFRDCPGGGLGLVPLPELDQVEQRTDGVLHRQLSRQLVDEIRGNTHRGTRRESLYYSPARQKEHVTLHFMGLL